MSLLLVLAAGYGFCFLITPVARTLAAKSGLVDQPDGRRKIHARPIPMAGGLAILLSSFAAIGLTLLLSEGLGECLREESNRLLGLLLASAMICALGVADDYRLLRGRHKLLGQILTVLVLVHFDWVVRSVHCFDWRIELGILAIPLTVIWLLGTINSLNLLDGMDGLLGSVGLILCLALAGMSALEQRWAAACIAVVLAGALIGFLRFNFPPATIFLGDAGSMLVGLLIGALTIHRSQQQPSVSLAIPIAFLTIPLFDTAAAIIRRKLTGRSIFTTDRGHLHHCLLRLRCSPRYVLLCVACFCLTGVAGGLAGVLHQNDFIALVSSAAIIGILIVTGVFGRAEFILLRDKCVGIIRSWLQPRATATDCQVAVQLQGKVEWTALWSNFLTETKRLNLVMVRLNVNAPAVHEGYHARWDSVHAADEETSVWCAEIPVMMDQQVLGRVEVVGRYDEIPLEAKMSRLTQLVAYFESQACTLLMAKSMPPGSMSIAPPPTDTTRRLKIASGTSCSA